MICWRVTSNWFCFFYLDMSRLQNTLELFKFINLLLYPCIGCMNCMILDSDIQSHTKLLIHFLVYIVYIL
jgi:hypothetical protein